MAIVLQIIKKASKKAAKLYKQSMEPFKIYSNTPNLSWTKDKSQKKRLVKTIKNKTKNK